MSLLERKDCFATSCILDGKADRGQISSCSRYVGCPSLADFVPCDRLLNKAHLDNLEERTKLQPALPGIDDGGSKGKQRI